MTQIDFHLQLNHNDNWSMSRLHFHDYCEFFLPLTSPGNIFVNDQVYPLQRGTLYFIGENALSLAVAAPEEEALLEQVLALRPGDRAVLYLFYYEGYSTQEVGGDAPPEPDRRHQPAPAGQEKAEGKIGTGGIP